MKNTILAALIVTSCALATPAAQAKGCLKGAAIGGVAGHVANHGVLGAAAGCAIGRHRANKKEREALAQRQQQQQGAHTASR